MSNDIQVFGQNINLERIEKFCVILSFDRKEFISAEQYQRLSEVLSANASDFVLINHTLVQKKDIRIIEPVYKQPKGKEFAGGVIFDK